MNPTTDIVPEAPRAPESPPIKKELPPVEKKFSKERTRNNGYAQEIKTSFDELEKNSPGVDLFPEKQELDQLKTKLGQTDSQAAQQLEIAQREVEGSVGTKQQDLDIKYGPGPGIQPRELSDLQGRRIGQSVGQVEWRARPDGTAIEDAFAPDLPPVRDGYTRLYRGNLPDTERSQYAISGKAKGRYFTENLSMAAVYGRNLRYVDVPTSELPRIQSYETRKGPIRLGEYVGNEYVIPDTLVPREEPSVERLSPEVIRKQKIREFTRSTEEGRRTRKWTAQEIVLERKAAEQQTREFNDIIAHTLEGISKGAIDYSQANDRINKLRSQLALRNVFLLRSVFDRIQPGHTQRMGKDLQSQQENAAKLKFNLEDYQNSLDILREQLSKFREERSSLKRTKQIIEEFYESQGDKLTIQEQKAARMEKEREEATVDKVAEKYGVYFIHAIRPDIGGVNNPEMKDTDWKTKLDVVLGLHPDISVSTIKSKDTLRENSFGLMGVVLSGGSVEAADSGDIWSTASLKERSTAIHLKSDYLSEQIKSAIEDRRDFDYNEFIISEPQVAGFFIDHGFDDPAESRQAPLEEIIPILQELGLPLFLFRNGSFYEQRYSIDPSGNVRLEDVVSEDPRNGISPADMVKRKAEIPQEMQLRLTKKAKKTLGLKEN